MITITIEYDVNRCSQNKREHWRGRAKTHAAARTAARLAWMAAGSPRLSTQPVILDIVVRRAHWLDYFNIHGACKPLIDGIFNDGITRDDSHKYLLPGSITQEISKEHKGREQVVFRVRHPEGNQVTTPT